MQPLGAGEVHERFVDRHRLDQRREVAHERADLARHAGIFLHVRRHIGGVRAELARLEDRHGGADAKGARHIAAGEHHAALAPADDDRLVGERGVVALFDGGVEGVAVDMGDRQRKQVLVAQQARGAAGRAARGRFRDVLPAVAAEATYRRIGGGLAQHTRHDKHLSSCVGVQVYGQYHEENCRIRVLAVVQQP